jgi:type VI secretion system secreted protein VgrG
VGGSAADVFANTQLLGVTTPLGKDALGLAQLGGVEALSRLFTYQLDLYAENGTADVAKALLGQPLTATVAGRPFNGICSRIAQGESGSTHTRYRAEVVPWLWLHGLGRDNRVFAQLTVPEIVQQVLEGRPLELRLQGSYEKWDYVFQRNESDLAFVSRLLEEEGIWYLFAHSEEGHTLVLGDSPEAHPSLPAVQFDEDGERKRGQLVYAWEAARELKAGKVTLWDHCFELPRDNLEGTATLPEHLRTAATEAAEIYDYPGGYAGRFDGVDAGGGDQPAELQKLFPAAERAAALRMQAEAAGAVTVAGASSVRALAAGSTFDLRGGSEGRYVLTSVSHRASVRGDRLHYANTFTCIPDAVPYRPPRATPRPFLGPETAVVTGPPGEEVFTDKYGRVQVKFHWDRSEGDSSPWIRVAQPAGGAFVSIPRIGDEVVVTFEHGDPDRPYVLGSLWNPDDMPPREGDER